MNWKKIGKALLFPHAAVLFVLTPVSAAFLVYAMVCLGTESIPAIASYVLAFYTLTVWCTKAPAIFRWVRIFKNQNPYIKRWRGDAGLRVNVSLFGALLWNAAYGGQLSGKGL